MTCEDWNHSLAGRSLRRIGAHRYLLLKEGFRLRCSCKCRYCCSCVRQSERRLYSQVLAPFNHLPLRAMFLSPAYSSWMSWVWCGSMRSSLTSSQDVLLVGFGQFGVLCSMDSVESFRGHFGTAPCWFALEGLCAAEEHPQRRELE